MSSLEDVEENLRRIKRRRTRTLTEDQRLDILHMYYACKRDHLRARSLASSSAASSSAAAAAVVGDRMNDIPAGSKANARVSR